MENKVGKERCPEDLMAMVRLMRSSINEGVLLVLKR